MDKFIEYRYIEKNKQMEKYISLLEKYGVDYFIKIVKLTGITINRYPETNKYSTLVKNLDNYIFANLSETDYKKWKKHLYESDLLNSCYMNLFSDDSYIKTLNIDNLQEISAFLIILEKALYYLNNKIQGHENDNLKSSINFDFKFAFETPYDEQINNCNMFDRLSFLANDILKYLLFYKHKKNTVASEVDEISMYYAFYHLKNIDKKEVLNTITDEWMFMDRGIEECENGIRSKIINKSLLEDKYISLNRVHQRRLEINNNIYSNNRVHSNDNEQYSKEYLKKALYGYSDDYCCIVNKTNIKLGHLIITYSLIQKLSYDFIKNRKNINSNKIKDICLFIPKTVLEENLLTCGIPKKEVIKLLSIITYNKRGDLFNNPLILNNTNFIVIPSIVSNLDIPQTILSLTDQFNFKGKLFEKSVLNLLRDNNILVNSEEYTDETGEYQCDIIFLLDNDLFICECKSWGEPNNTRQFYNQLDKYYEAKAQLKRIAEKYIEKKDWLKNKFNFLGEFRNITKIVITSNTIGSNNKIDDTYFIDYSSFCSFILRNKPTIRLKDGNNEYCYNLPKYNEFDGKITYNKIINFLNNPSTVDFTRKKMKKDIRSIPFNNLKIDYEVYENKISTFSSIDNNIYEYMTQLEKIFNLK